MVGAASRAALETLVRESPARLAGPTGGGGALAGGTASQNGSHHNGNGSREKLPPVRAPAALTPDVHELAARQLLQRTGVVFRKTITREKLPVTWGELIRI